MSHLNEKIDTIGQRFDEDDPLTQDQKALLALTRKLGQATGMLEIIYHTLNKSDDEAAKHQARVVKEWLAEQEAAC